MATLKHAAIYTLASLVLGGVFALYAQPHFVAVAGDVMWSCMGMGEGAEGSSHVHGQPPTPSQPAHSH